MEKGQREFLSLPFWCDPVLSLFLFLPVDCGTEDGQRSKDDGGDGEVQHLHIASAVPAREVVKGCRLRKGDSPGKGPCDRI